MIDPEALKQIRLQAAEIAISFHRDAIGRTHFTDAHDIGGSFTQLLTSLQIYAKEMGLNFEAACNDDEENLWDEPVDSEVADQSNKP